MISLWESASHSGPPEAWERDATSFLSAEWGLSDRRVSTDETSGQHLPGGQT